MKDLGIIYHNKASLNPAIFDISLIKKSGIYQLNEFIIRCKVLLNQLCNDIKNNELHDKDYYIHFT